MPETSNKIIQKGLAFLLKQSGTLVSSGPLTCSGILPRRLPSPRRGFGGAAQRRLEPKEDLNVTVYEEATFCVIGNTCHCCKVLATGRYRSQDEEARS